MKKKFSAVCVSILFCLSVFPTVGTAGSSATTETSVGVEAGELRIVAPNLIKSFGNTKITGDIKVVSADLGPVRVIDATGTDSGWRVLVESTKFNEVGGKNFSLPAASLSLSRPSSITAINGTPSEMPSIDLTSSIVLDSGNQYTIASADVGSGAGTFDINLASPTISLVINPSTAKIDLAHYPTSPTPYLSTITWSVVAGP